MTEQQAIISTLLDILINEIECIGERLDYLQALKARVEMMIPLAEADDEQAD